MEIRDAAVLSMYENPRTTERMVEDNDGAIAPVEAFLSGIGEIFRSAPAGHGSIADEWYSTGEYVAAFATVEEAMQRALSIRVRVRSLAARLGVRGGVSAGLAFGPVPLHPDNGPLGDTTTLAVELREHAGLREVDGRFLMSECAASLLEPVLGKHFAAGPRVEHRRLGEFQSVSFRWDDLDATYAARFAGKTLGNLFEAGERFELWETAAFMDRLCAALHSAHEAGIVHCNLTHESVFVDADGRMRLGDSSCAPEPGTPSGTPVSIAPEELSGVKIDRRTDIFSAGAILYWLLTGERLFSANRAWSQPPPASFFNTASPPALDAVARKALAKEPKSRFASAEEFRRALRAAVIDLPAAK